VRETAAGQDQQREHEKGQRAFETRGRELYDCFRGGDQQCEENEVKFFPSWSGHDQGKCRDRQNDGDPQRREWQVFKDAAHTQKRQTPQRVGEDLHPVDHVPTKTKAVVKVVDDAEGDEGIVTEPGVADHQPDEDSDDRGKEGPGVALLAGGGFVVQGSQ
jgi:hypothetical protein